MFDTDNFIRHEMSAETVKYVETKIIIIIIIIIIITATLSRPSYTGSTLQYIKSGPLSKII